MKVRNGLFFVLAFMGLSTAPVAQATVHCTEPVIQGILNFDQILSEVRVSDAGEGQLKLRGWIGGGSMVADWTAYQPAKESSKEVKAELIGWVDSQALRVTFNQKTVTKKNRTWQEVTANGWFGRAGWGSMGFKPGEKEGDVLLISANTDRGLASLRIANDKKRTGELTMSGFVTRNSSLGLSSTTSAGSVNWRGWAGPNTGTGRAADLTINQCIDQESAAAGLNLTRDGSLAAPSMFLFVLSLVNSLP